MPTSTEEALREFFTEERLEYYRDLHERFPLWCGDWPENLVPLPESYSWGLQSRLHEESRPRLEPQAARSLRGMGPDGFEPSTSRLSGWGRTLASAGNVASFGASPPVGADWRWLALTPPLTRAVTVVATVEQLYPIN